jgi:hypothetical protein
MGGSSSPVQALVRPSLPPQNRLEAGQFGWGQVVGMLLYRTLLFALFQALIAVGFLWAVHPQPWQASVAYWPATAALTGAVGWVLLNRLARLEGIRYRDLIGFDRRFIAQDLLLTLALLALSAGLVMLPSYWLGVGLFGDPNLPSNLFFKPLPIWVAGLCLVLFPLSVALTELPTYFAYVMPRVAALSGRAWLAVLLPVLMLSFQHATLPLIFDWRFIVWRMWMFFGFALLIGLGLYWRPRLLPYLMLVHGLLDFATAWMVWGLARA